jgi:ferritin-like metal-binding protein YciE
MADTSVEVVKRYLQDAIAAEKNFETQLQGFAKETGNEPTKAVFQNHIAETRGQIERLTKRLEQLGDTPSAAKSLLAHVFHFAPKAAQLSRDKEGREKEGSTTQDLILAFAIENNECAIYESLASTAEAAGDPETAALARSIQAEEKAAADKIWGLLGSAARREYLGTTEKSVSTPS